MYQICEKIYKERPLSRIAFHQSVDALDLMNMMPPEKHGLNFNNKTLQLVGLVCVFEAIR